MSQKSLFCQQNVLLWSDRLKAQLCQVSLVVAPVVAGSMMVAAPTQAATFSLANASVELTNFSHRPASVFTNAETSTFTISQNGNATAIADADATFINAPFLPVEASNFTLSEASGFGKSYFGLAESTATVAGIQFEIAAQETFSFDFEALLILFSSVDHPGKEFAQATGGIFFQLFDTTDSEEGTLLDSLSLLVSLSTPSRDDFLSFDSSPNISFTDITEEFFSTDNQKFFLLAGAGRFERTFERLTYLTLLEVKFTEATVATTPEPTSLLTLLILALVGMSWQKRSQRSQLNQSTQP